MPGEPVSVTPMAAWGLLDDSVVALQVRIVRQLKTDALRTASRLFSLTEHEVAHEGDSLDCGHDEGFYQRFHYISTACAAHRQHFMHVWLMKYTISLEGAGRRAKGRVWQERSLAERVSTPGIITDDSLSEAITAPVEPEEGHRPTFLNQQFGADGTQSLASVNWAEVAAEGGEVVRRSQERKAELARFREDEREASLSSPVTFSVKKTMRSI